jgi:two-component system sensor histidine kinase KdpD
LLVLGLALVPFRDDATPATPGLLFVIPVVVAAVVGGRWSAVVVAVTAALVFNLVFVEPYGTMMVGAADDGVALAVFVLVALATGTLVAIAGERQRSAEQRARDIEELHAQVEAVQAERERLIGEAAKAQLLARVDEQRTALLRSVSHDLRTPLAAIKAVASDLRDGTVYDEATRVELLDTVIDEVERLDRLVANLLSMGRIEAGALGAERQAVDIDELTRERVRRLSRLFAGVRVQLDLDPELPLVDGDYTQLEQVVTNLLENAARYAPPGSMVRVGTRLRPDGRIELAVADEGIGVPAHERQRIFEPFHRGEGSRSSGVGLAICRGVVEAHGGTVEVEQTPGGGATCLVTRPARHD